MLQKTHFFNVFIFILSTLCYTSTSEKPKYKCETCDGIVDNFRKVRNFTVTGNL